MEQQEKVLLKEAEKKECVSCGDLDGVNEYEMEEGNKVLLCDYCYEQILECGDEDYEYEDCDEEEIPESIEAERQENFCN